jgi:adenylate kinase family enzyme
VGPEQLSQRYVVVGTSGSGKTTLARRLAQRLEIPHVELDALHWDPNWTPVPREVFCERVTRALGGETWTTDGNYSAVRETIWRRADTVVWLDYSLPVILWRITSRTIRRVVTREELWNENRERFSTSFLSRDSIILWSLQTYRRRRREYPLLFAQPKFAHLKVVHLRSPAEARQWVNAQGRGAELAKAGGLGTMDGVL